MFSLRKMYRKNAPSALSPWRTRAFAVNDKCRACGLCVRICPEKAIHFEQKADTFDKDSWKDFLIFVEQERGDIHPVAFELIGEARKMAPKVDYKVNCVIVGGAGTGKKRRKTPGLRRGQGLCL